MPANDVSRSVVALEAQRAVQRQSVGMKTEELLSLNQFQDVDASVFFGDMHSEHGHGILTQHRPAPNVGQLQSVGLQIDVRSTGPLVGLQALHLEYKKPRLEHVCSKKILLKQMVCLFWKP